MLLAAVGVLLNIAVNDRVVEARVVIAAGGTAGHVRPALAVAEALRARGVTVTFAGTPDRVESRLVPEAGFELDTFPISGFPRRPGLALVRALVRAAKAPFPCRRILRRRRPDVVLGGGGYVAGPMVLAARLRGIPAALTEADAHLGLANRLAAPFARRVFLAYEIDGRSGGKYRVVGRPIPACPSRRDAARRQGALRSSRRSARRGRLRRARRRALAERDGRRRLGRRGPGRAAHLRRAGLRVARGARLATGLRADAADGSLRRRARRRRSRRLAGRRHRLGARRGRHAVGPRAVPARDRRPPDAQRAPLRARRRRDRRARRRGRRWCPALVADLLADPARLDGDARRRCSRWRGRTRPRRSPRS